MSPELVVLKETLQRCFKAEVKYVDEMKVKRLPNKELFTILDNNIITDFDYSWHHDETDEPYIICIR
jgi:hypothetical protein